MVYCCLGKQTTCASKTRSDSSNEVFDMKETFGESAPANAISGMLYLNVEDHHVKTRTTVAELLSTAVNEETDEKVNKLVINDRQLSVDFTAESVGFEGDYVEECQNSKCIPLSTVSNYQLLELPPLPVPRISLPYRPTTAGFDNNTYCRI